MLHKKNAQREVKPKCTAICNQEEGGLSCAKIVLVDVFDGKNPEKLFRVYAIVDDKSNSFMISSELADEIGADGPPEKYLLSTCTSSKEVSYGRRVDNLQVRSMNDTVMRLPTLKCGQLPSDKKEIPTPDLAKNYAHLRDIANEIPPIDPEAEVHVPESSRV
ncbi:predicted protein [Nematostella vectensis]|uniref:Uncharacterized protein n=1 Tax=Nematostella vectensis TaxID=45351 RepID=A7S862_NEMVE|nr:predicted protein [Nematostella vectensis]|eukprot:XP_001632173.1 predicted protein [Nematostella vectensis]